MRSRHAAAAPAGWLLLESAAAWVLPALGDADRIVPRDGPAPEPRERGPLTALRAGADGATRFAGPTTPTDK